MADEFEGKIDAEGKFELTRSFWKTLRGTFALPQVSRRLAEAAQKKKVLDWYDIRDYPLDTARDDEFITGFPSRGGDCILVLSITEGASTQIKFDNVNSDSFELANYRKLRHNFSNFYLTNTAQAGSTLKILFGRGDWEVVRHHPEEEIMAINADTVDGLHASASIEAGKLLALGPDGFFPCGAVRCLQNELFANRPATPQVGHVFVSTDTSQLFICYTAGVWTQIYTAASIGIVDAGGFYAGTDVEAALQELGPYMADVDGFPDELKDLTAAEILQLENIGAATISALQWGYLGACGAGGGQLMAALTAVESTQLENIGVTTISAAQWGYLGAMSQGVVIGSVPAFQVHPAIKQLNIATSADVTVAFGTERYDIGGNFAANVFTAPVTGKYLLSVSLRVENLDTGSSYYQLLIATSNFTYKTIFNVSKFSADIPYWSFILTIVADMDATDTAYVAIRQEGGAAQADIDTESYFSGVLVA